jgi:hypothetical protein
MRDLSVIQEARRAFDARFAWTNADLELPRRLFEARRRDANGEHDRLDRAAAALRAGRASEARSLLAGGN